MVDWTENGLETSFNLNGLSLQSGVTYHISVKATDALGNESDPFISDGVTADFFVPTVGLPVEGELDEDIDWQSSTTSILVSWTGNDTRSREIASFDYSIGTSIGGTDVVEWTSAGNSTQVSIEDLNLTIAETYYCNVRATDAAGNVSTVSTSDGVSIDPLDPVGGSVIDGEIEDLSFTESSVTLTGTWEGFVDDLSGIAYYHVAVGTSPGEDDTYAWNEIDTVNSYTFENLSLDNGTTYFVSVKAFDQAQNASEVISSNGIVSDQEGPVSGNVVDGLDSQGIEWVMSSTDLQASWSNFSDPLSGIEFYEYGVGTTPGNTDTKGWTNIDLETSVSITDLSLSHGQEYFISVRGIDQVGNVGSHASSDGLIVDLVEPVVLEVFETYSDLSEIDYMNQTDTLTLRWSGEDELSGIEKFEVWFGKYRRQCCFRLVRYA